MEQRGTTREFMQSEGLKDKNTEGALATVQVWPKIQIQLCLCLCTVSDVHTDVPTLKNGTCRTGNRHGGG